MKVYPVTLMVKILTDYLRGGSFKPYCLVGKENWEPQNLRSPSKKCSRGHVSRNGAKSSILLSLAGEMSLGTKIAIQENNPLNLQVRVPDNHPLHPLNRADRIKELNVVLVTDLVTLPSFVGTDREGVEVQKHLVGPRRVMLM